LLIEQLDSKEIFINAYTFTGGLVVPQLLEWLKIHFTTAERMFGDLVKEEQPEHRSTYWDTVRQGYNRAGVQ
jgi:hypothetical protein